MTSKNKKIYVEQFSDKVPVFFKPVWLNYVSGDNWDVLFYKDKEKETIRAVFVYCIQKNEIIVPPFTPFSGPYFFLDHLKYPDKLSHEFRALEYFSLELEKLKINVNQKWHNSIQNWLPFYWQGFEQTTRYTYVISPSDLQGIWKNIKEAAQRQIKKGIKNLTINDEFNAELFYQLITKTYQDKNQKVPYTFDSLSKLISHISRNNLGTLKIAYNEQNQPVGAILLVWDETTIYYLIGGLDHTLDQYGTMSFLLWKGIEFSNLNQKKFDFHGSMLKAVERFFRNFNGQLLSYYRITKTNKRKSLSKRFLNLLSR